MRLAFDCTFLLSPRTGVGTFASAVLERLAQRKDLEIRAYAVAWRQGEAVAAQLPDSVEMARRSELLSPLHTRAAWKRSNFPPIEWITGPVDVVHSPNFIAPPARNAAMIATVHDLTFVHHPEHCTTDTRKFPPLIQRTVDRGGWIHTVSHAIASEVVEVFDAPPERVVVVHNAVDPLPQTEPGHGRAVAGADRYVLALGTVEPRKNLPRLVAAWDRLADRDRHLHLVIAGADGWGSDALDGACTVARNTGRIVRLGWVDADDRAALLRDAAVLAYPSLYEGFGLPPLEAMDAGVPVVAGRAGALPEVVGDAAVLVDPLDVDAIEHALSSVLDDDDLAETLRSRGARRVGEFSWDRATEELVTLYRRAAAER